MDDNIDAEIPWKKKTVMVGGAEMYHLKNIVEKRITE
jgi:hypothetical protein